MISRLPPVLAFLVTVAVLPASGADDYTLGPDSTRLEGVPAGTVTKHSFAESRIFPGTRRDYWVYVPRQYDGAKPACVMVFQDGGGYVGEQGNWRVPIVFDNLIHRREMPVTIGVFINPGVVPAANSNALPRYNRSYEYDGLGDAYARFLLDEILPHVAREQKLNLSTNGNDRAIGGASSGAICAFTAAWERPDAFQRVFSTIGTYVGLRGGNDYPTLIRKTEPKPIRIYLQDGSNDLNIYGGSWWVANQDMLSALQYAGYEATHAWGDGGHTSKHGAALLPEALRWLWKDWPNPVRAGVNSKQNVMTDVLLPGEGWQLVSSGHGFTEGPAVNAKGELYFTDIPKSRIHKVSLDGKVTLFAEDTGEANGLVFGADGMLYACAHGKKALTRYDDAGQAEVILEGVESNDVVSRAARDGYFTDPGNKKVWYIDSEGNHRTVDTGIAFPNGVITSPDQSLLYVSDTRGPFVFSFQIQPDGSLAHKQRYFHLHLGDGDSDSGADGMTVDTQGRLYVTTRIGVQYCDQAGRVNGIIPKPGKGWLSNAVFGGPERNELFVTCGEAVYKRKTRATGVLPFAAPIKPPAPRL